MSYSLLIFVSEVLKSLVRHERNQQLMCEAGMVHELLIICEAALVDESHPLNSYVQYILERLAAQSLRPRELRWAVSTTLFLLGRYALWPDVECQVSKHEFLIYRRNWRKSNFQVSDSFGIRIHNELNLCSVCRAGITLLSPTDRTLGENWGTCRYFKPIHSYNTRKYSEKRTRVEPMEDMAWHRFR